MSDSDSRSDGGTSATSPWARTTPTWVAALVTLSAPLVLWLLGLVPIPSVTSTSPVATATSLGIAPFVTASFLVEVVSLILPSWRRSRVAGRDAHATRLWMTWGLGALIAGFQAFAMHDAVVASAAPGERPAIELMVFWLVAGSALLLVIARAMTRYGLIDGVVSLMAGGALLHLVQVAAYGAAWARPDALPRGMALVAALTALIWIATWRVTRPSRAVAETLKTDGYREPPRGDGEPAFVELPSAPAGFVTFNGAASTVALLAVGWSGGSAPNGSNSQAVVVAVSALVAFAIGACILRPRAIGRVWARALGESEAPVDVLVRRARRQALLRGTALAAAASAVALAFPVPVVISVTGLGLLVAAFVDARASLAARRAIHLPQSVWFEPRAWAAGAAVEALRRAGIVAEARDHVAASLMPFAGPLVPTTIYVTAADVERARAVLDRVLPAEPEGPPVLGVAHGRAIPRKENQAAVKRSLADEVVRAALLVLLPFALRAAYEWEPMDAPARKPGALQPVAPPSPSDDLEEAR